MLLRLGSWEEVWSVDFVLRLGSWEGACVDYIFKVGIMGVGNMF